MSTISWGGGGAILRLLAGGAVLCPWVAAATLIKTTDLGVVAAFQSGASMESFDTLTAFPITSYGAGQNIDPAATFSSRDGNTQPTFHSGGGSFNDPVGNPGTPIGIVKPEGGIAGDVKSPDNVAGPLVINSEELFNFGFMEIIFPAEVSRVGFWVTHGAVKLDVRDDTGSSPGSGDVTVTGVAGEFIGIERTSADIKVAALFGDGTASFTIDDVTWGRSGSTPPPPGVPDTGVLWNLLLAGAGLAWARKRLV